MGDVEREQPVAPPLPEIVESEDQVQAELPPPLVKSESPVQADPPIPRAKSAEQAQAVLSPPRDEPEEDRGPLLAPDELSVPPEAARPLAEESAGPAENVGRPFLPAGLQAHREPPGGSLSALEPPAARQNGEPEYQPEPPEFSQMPDWARTASAGLDGPGATDAIEARLGEIVELLREIKDKPSGAAVFG